MIVINNFLNLSTLSLLRMAIENELMMKDTAIGARRDNEHLAN
jgi:hypothetical protein